MTKSSFKKAYIISSVALLMCCVVGFFVLYGFLAGYEERAAERDRLHAQTELEQRRRARLSSEVNRLKQLTAQLAAGDEYKNSLLARYSASLRCSAEYAARSLCERIKKEGWGGIEELIACQLGPYDDMQSLIAHMTEEYDPAGLTYMVKSGAEYARLLCGGEEAATLTLAAEEEPVYGFRVYEVTSVQPRIAFEDIRITVPSGMTVKINTKPLAQQGAGQPAPGFESIPGEEPVVDVYEVSGLLPGMLVEAEYGGEGAECVRSGDTFMCGLPGAEQARVRLHGEIQTLVHSYGDFLAGDIEFSELERCLLAGTDIHRALRGLDNRWYFYHKGLINTDAEISEFYIYGEGFIRCRASYTQKLTNYAGKVTKECPVDVSLCLVKDGGRWLIADLKTDL